MITKRTRTDLLNFISQIIREHEEQNSDIVADKLIGSGWCVVNEHKKPREWYLIFDVTGRSYIQDSPLKISGNISKCVHVREVLPSTCPICNKEYEDFGSHICEKSSEPKHNFSCKWCSATSEDGINWIVLSDAILKCREHTPIEQPKERLAEEKILRELKSIKGNDAFDVTDIKMALIEYFQTKVEK